MNCAPLCKSIILPDTFEQFAQPLMRGLNWLTLFCHRLIVENDRIKGYQLRQPNQKQKSVAALKSLNYHVVSAGIPTTTPRCYCLRPTWVSDSRAGHVKREFPQLKAVESHAELLKLIKGRWPPIWKSGIQEKELALSVS